MVAYFMDSIKNINFLRKYLVFLIIIDKALTISKKFARTLLKAITKDIIDLKLSYILFHFLQMITFKLA